MFFLTDRNILPIILYPKSSLFPLFFFAPDLQMKLTQLFLIDRGGCVHEEVEGALGFGEGDDLTNALLIGAEHDQAIEAQGDSAVRGCAVFKSFEHMPELLFDLLIAQVHQREDLMLESGDVDAYAPSADFVAIADNIVLFGADIKRIAVQAVDMRLIHAG